MGNCYSRNIETNRHRNSRYRLLSRLFKRNESQPNRTKDRKKRGKNINEEHEPLNVSKRKQKDSQRIKQLAEEIEIYPFNEESGECNGIGRTENNDAEKHVSSSRMESIEERIIRSDLSVEIPRLGNIVKVVVASVHEDMTEERVVLTKRIYPDLNTYCRELGYDLVIIDLNIDDDQYKYKDWMEEIAKAHEESTAVGFMVLVGENLGERELPGKIDSKVFESLKRNLTTKRKILEENYEVRTLGDVPCYIMKEKVEEESDTEEEDRDEARLSFILMEDIKEKQKRRTGSKKRCVFNALLQVAAVGQELSDNISGALWVERVAHAGLMADETEYNTVRRLYKQCEIVRYPELTRHDKSGQEEFYNSVLGYLKKSLRTAIKKQGNVREKTKEIAQHLKRCHKEVDTEAVEPDIQITIRSYLRKNSKYPLVVHGTPGCGKTHVVAMAAKHAGHASEGAVLVIRFLGTTRYSSNLRFLLESVCFQLAQFYKDERKELPKDLQSLVRLFHNYLQKATKARPIWMMFDGLDELTKVDQQWLPRELPDHVRVVVTTLTNGGCYEKMRSSVRDAGHFINISELDESHLEACVSKWCAEQHIDENDELPQRMLQALCKYPNPLYLNLMLQHYKHKPSLATKPHTPMHVPNSLKHVIEHYFVAMETKHGKSVIGRIMGYLAGARYGLSEHELQDILYEDRKSGQKNSSILHFGSFKLSRILDDLSPCLTRAYVDGTTLITWTHIIIRYLAFDRYLAKRSDAMSLTFNMLANYFERARTNDSLATLRRLFDLPHYLCRIGSVERLKRVAVCNYQFLLAQLKATSVDYVLECFADKQCPIDHDLKMLGNALKMSSDGLNLDPDQLAAQLIGRLTDLASSEHLSRLLNEAKMSSVNALLPYTGCLNAPGTKLLHTSLDLHGPVDMTSDSTLGISITKTQIALWDMRSAKIIRATQKEANTKQVLFCRNNRLFVTQTAHCLRVYETSTFKRIWRLECTEKVYCISLAGEVNDILVGACGTVIRLWNLRNGQAMTEITDTKQHTNIISGWRDYIACASTTQRYVHIYDVNTSILVSHIEAYSDTDECTVDSVLISSIGDGQVMVYSENSFDLRIYRLSNGEWLRTIGPDIVNPRLTSDGRYVLATSTRNDITIWSMETGVKMTNVFRHPPTSIITNIVANDLTKLITLCDNKILRVWDLDKEETVQQSLSQERDDNCIRNIMFIKTKGEQRQAVSRSKVSGDICVWNIRNCTPLRVLKGTQADDVLVVDETRAVLRSMGKLALIDLEEGRLIKKLRLSFPRLASRNRMERRASSLYKRRNLSLRLLQRSGVTSRARVAQFTDVAIVGEKYVLVLSSKRDVITLISLDDGKLVEKLDSGHRQCVETILVSDNGKTLVCSYEKAPAALWNLDSRRVVGWLRVDNAFPKLCIACLTRDGRYLVDALKINDCVHLIAWDLNVSDVQCRITLEGARVQAVAASSKSGFIICSYTKNYINTIKVYMLRSGSVVSALPSNPRQQINTIHLSLDGKRALTFATGERTIRLWDTKSTTQVGSFTADHTISDCALSEDGNNVIIAVYKASTITSLTVANQNKCEEMSVDQSNPYCNPENYGAVFEFMNILDWDDDTELMDNTLAEKQ